MRNQFVWAAVTVGAWCVSPGAQAAMAVVDAAAIAKLASQIETLEAQLQQAQAEFDSMTGGRGMEGLLAGTVRNYLPADWATLEAALRAAGTSPLGRQVDALVTANAILSAAQVGTLSAEERETLDSARRSAALLQVTTREALERTSERFDALEELIGAIGTAGDQKAVLDLQARIAAEQSMLQNEQTKLLVLFQLAHAEELARKQRARERAIAGIGALRRLPPVGLNN